MARDHDDRPGAGGTDDPGVRLGLGELTPYPALARIAAHWCAAARLGGTPLPARAAICPRQIGPALGEAFLAEEIAPGHLMLRVAGRHLDLLAGTGARGLTLSCLVSARSRDALEEVIRTACAEGRPARLQLRARAQRFRPALEAALLLLPLARQIGGPVKVLGGIEAPGLGAQMGPGLAQGHRFQISASVLGARGVPPAPLPAGITPTTEGAAGANGAAQVNGAAWAVPSPIPLNGRRGARPMLRLVHSRGAPGPAR